jgi:hypothetical protein
LIADNAAVFPDSITADKINLGNQRGRNLGNLFKRRIKACQSG